MKKLCGLFVCMMLIVAVQPIIGARSNMVQSSNNISSVKIKDNVDWVLMFYQNGDNKLSPYIDVCLDLIETVGATDDVKIAVLIDKKPINDTTLYYYEGTNAVKQDWPAESDMSDPETIVQFAEKVMSDNDIPKSSNDFLSASGRIPLLSSDCKLHVRGSSQPSYSPTCILFLASVLLSFKSLKLNRP